MLNLPAALPYKTFCECRPAPDYDPEYWDLCRALYAGGHRLLDNRKVLEKLLPKHNNEPKYVYEERCGMAEFFPYPGEIVDRLVAGLFSEPVVMESEVKPDPFYEAFHLDCSPLGGKVTSFNDHLRGLVLKALQCQRSWTLVELPKAGEGITPQSLADQEQLGLLNVYITEVEPECVRDWEMSGDGELEWALLAFKEQKRGSLVEERDWTVERFVYYTPTESATYEIRYKTAEGPKEDSPVSQVAYAPHSFGRVPLVPFELPEGLWAMGKLECMARSFLIKRSMLSWAEYKSLMPTPTAFLEQKPEEPDEVTENPKRAVSQARSPAHIVTLGEKDRFEYIGPSSEPFKALMDDLHDLRDEMHRVTHLMAMSVDNSGAALQRSAASKQADQSETNAVLTAIDDRIGKHAVVVHQLVQAARGDAPNVWTAKPRRFNRQDMTSVNNTATTVDAISIPSATFQRVFKSAYAEQACLEIGRELSEQERTDIDKDLEETITNEQYSAPMKALEQVGKGEPEEKEAPGEKPAESTFPPEKTEEKE